MLLKWTAGALNQSCSSGGISHQSSSPAHLIHLIHTASSRRVTCSGFSSVPAPQTVHRPFLSVFSSAPRAHSGVHTVVLGVVAHDVPTIRHEELARVLPWFSEERIMADVSGLVRAGEQPYAKSWTGRKGVRGRSKPGSYIPYVAHDILEECRRVIFPPEARA